MVSPHQPGSLGPKVSLPLTAAKAYEQKIRKQVLDPFVTRIRDRVSRARQNYLAIRQDIAAIPQSPTLVGLSGDLARVEMNRLKAMHTARFTKLMSSALGVNITPFMADLGVQGTMTQAITRNAALIRTIPAKFHARFMSQLTILSANTPFDEAELSKVINQTYKLSGYDLRRLTRDQTSKLNGELNRARQEQVGVREYVWSSSGDGRVRPSHVANDGLTFSWQNPPAGTGHPGEDIQCRCVALAVLPKAMPRPGQPSAPPVATKAARARPSPPRAPTLPTTLNRGLSSRRFRYRADKTTSGDLHEADPRYINTTANTNLRRYTSGGDASLNKALREGQRLRQFDQELLKGLDEVQSALGNDRVMYRGMTFGRNQTVPQYVKGDVLPLKTPTSASRSNSVAHEFAKYGPYGDAPATNTKIMLEIHTKANTRAIVTNVEEAEYILQQGQRMRVLGVKRNVRVTETAGNEYLGRPPFSDVFDQVVQVVIE